jgi:hypothetical protein
MKFAVRLAVALAALSFAAPALAQNAYITGDSNPWFIPDANAGSPETAMNTAFGVGNWTKTQGFTTAVFSGNSFVYLDGGDGVGVENFFVNGGGKAALEAFVLGGGRAFVNAARNDTFASFEVGFGLSLVGNQFSGSAALTAAGIAAGFGANGAGSNWTGTAFSHDSVVCAISAACDGATTTFITGTAGDIVVGGSFGSGYLLVGGQTLPFFHSPQAAAFALRANQLTFTSSQGGVVPEPASWAMLIIGFGLVGAAMRRRRIAAA